MYPTARNRKRFNHLCFSFSEQDTFGKYVSRSPRCPHRCKNRPEGRATSFPSLQSVRPIDHNASACKTKFARDISRPPDKFRISIVALEHYKKRKAKKGCGHQVVFPRRRATAAPPRDRTFTCHEYEPTLARADTEMRELGTEIESLPTLRQKGSRGMPSIAATYW